MSLDRYGDDETQAHVAEQTDSSLVVSFFRKLSPDPRKAPSRIAKILLGVFIFLVTLGIWGAFYLNVDSGGSSYWFLRTVIGFLKHPIVPPLASIVVYYRYVGARRSWAARTAADTTGWLIESVQQLADEMRSTKGMRPVIVTSDMDQAEIEDYLDKALAGEEYDAETIDYWSQVRNEHAGDGDASGGVTPASADEREIAGELEACDPVDIDRETLQDGVDDAERLALSLRNADPSFQADPPDAVAGWRDDTDADAAPEPDSAGLLARHWNALTGALGGPFGGSSETPEAPDDTSTSTSEPSTSRRAPDPFASPSDGGDEPAAPSESAKPTGDDAVPWHIAATEELKQQSLYMTAALGSGSILWRLGVPYLFVAAIQLIYSGLWVGPVTAAVILFGTSPLIALGTFYGLAKLRSRRIDRHRTPSETEFWEAKMGLVKAVDTPDVTCYMGRAAGRSYASYSREEFITEFAARLHQMTDEHAEVAPSVMEQYARNLRQMKPNLPGHTRNVEIPSINREIKTTVESAEDELIPKSKLAYQVITKASDTRFGRNLGHDPALVRERYREMVEDEHSLAEITLPTETASGEEVELTLVYPADKRRLPEMSQLQSRFSERFMGAHGEPIYDLPDVEPTEDLHGIDVPDRAYELMPNPPELPSAGTASAD
ncbi:hypothetical protein [Halostella litorea]|uniref:hypothetical protein n=1 Tax=Halostella litorea TaxID=2528831 RepID=UPI0010925B9B|nr:hypothetical protein [Halostella litorea]